MTNFLSVLSLKLFEDNFKSFLNFKKLKSLSERGAYNFQQSGLGRSYRRAVLQMVGRLPHHHVDNLVWKNTSQ